jgi:hypothetical protein
MLSFDKLIRTTRTVVADSNIVVDKAKLFEILPISEYTFPAKKNTLCKPRRKRTSKKSISGQSGGDEQPEPIAFQSGTGNIVESSMCASLRNLVSGSIIFAGYGNKTKGVSPKGSTSTFKNSITIVMVIKQRLVNFKLTQNGRFHITGNNDNYHIEKCIKHMWKFIQQYPDIYTIDGTSVKVTVWPSMVNMKTNVGFRLDRQSLNTYVNTQTEYISMFETSSGSASVNVKMPLQAAPLTLNTLTYRSGKWVRGTTVVNMDTISKPRPKPKHGQLLSFKGGKMSDMSGRFVTFLVFHTGEIIMSSLDEQLMEPYFNKFVEILNDSRAEIEVK